MSKRKVRQPGLPATYDEALEAEILDVMRDWPAAMEARLKASGLENFAGGDFLWQRKFEAELENPDREPDTIATIVWLAEHGHVSAQHALRNHTTELLEDPKADLPSSVRAYLVRLINGLVPLHPEDRSEVIKNMLRNVGIRAMVKVAAARWPLSRLNSSAHRHSAAWFVARVMTDYGTKLEEQQVRRIYQDHPKLAQRLAKFLLGSAGKDQSF